MARHKTRTKGTARSGGGAEAVASGECKTLSVPEAGALYYDLGRNGSYKAAKCGVIPTITVLGKKRVPIILMERRMEKPDTTEAEISDADGAVA